VLRLCPAAGEDPPHALAQWLSPAEQARRIEKNPGCHRPTMSEEAARGPLQPRPRAGMLQARIDSGLSASLVERRDC
jgi:hypothetical protein